MSFRLKDNNSIIECFGSVWQIQTPLQDGMEVVVAGNPRLSAKWGKFSVSISAIKPVGQGSILKSLQLLKSKLEAEGLFDVDRKRPLPAYPMKIGVVSSEQADGYKDFLKITKQRWPLATIVFAHSLVQGDEAPKQITASLNALNQTDVDVIAVVRGGGSSEDLLAFSSEPVVRAVAASRVPVVVGVGHEADIALSQLAADKSASTPTDAAQIITPDMEQFDLLVDRSLRDLHSGLELRFTHTKDLIGLFEQSAIRSSAKISHKLETLDNQLFAGVQTALRVNENRVGGLTRVLHQLDPHNILRQGYAMVKRGDTIVTKAKDLNTDDVIHLVLKDATKKAKIL